MSKKGGKFSPEDEAYFEELEKETRKEARLDRKIAKRRDRSQYKKTDQDKQKKTNDLHENLSVQKEDLQRGRVIAVGGERYVVSSEGKEIYCYLRGLLKKDRTRLKNLITIGDFVLFELVDGGEGSICHVEERRSVLARSDNLSRRKQHLIAANLDMVLITVSAEQPGLKPSLVDRYIIATRKGGMDAVIIVNKMDLLEEYEGLDEYIQEFVDAYSKLGIPVIPVSTKTGEGIEDIKALMKDKASVFSGQSGVGKSSLINAITGLNLLTASIVEHTQKGAHTTTAAKLVELEFGGWVIDTPGIKSFGVWDLTEAELGSYFPDIAEIGQKCRFQPCLHDHEPSCAVKIAIEEEELSFMRYESYIALLYSLREKHLRR